MTVLKYGLDLLQWHASNRDLFSLKLYCYNEFLLLISMTTSLRNCCIIWTKKTVKHCITKI